MTAKIRNNYELCTIYYELFVILQPNNTKIIMSNTTIPQEFNNFFLKDVSFVNLMTRRIFNVLIVANPYDAFMLEDDGRVDEKIFDEYMELGMRYPPTFTQVSTTEEASSVLQTTDIDLVICMPGNADNDAFAVARDVKQMAPQIPCVVLTPFSHGITKRIENEDMSACWRASASAGRASPAESCMRTSNRGQPLLIMGYPGVQYTYT